ncbi:MAG: branched-chain amino acid ABC transporter permease, partial [Chloroflexi bacterium]|nr:branched-chain amino acid ABC transporter permease [Chloroflexota bacterium]
MSRKTGERSRSPGWIALAVLLLAAALLPALTDRKDVLSLAFLVLLSVTLGQSWNMLGGFAGQINLGHAAFFGIGALVTRQLWLSRGAPLPMAFVAGGLAACLFALVIGVPTFRLRGAYFAIGTLGLAEVLRITVSNVLPTISALPAALTAEYELSSRYWLALGLAVASTGVALGMARSRLGLGLFALREDEQAASASGVDIRRHKLAALTVSSLFAGLAGATFAYYQVSYYAALAFEPSWTFDALIITFVGGVGTVIGPVIGAIFYVVAREELATTLTQFHLVIFGTLF